MDSAVITWIKFQWGKWIAGKVDKVLVGDAEKFRDSVLFWQTAKSRAWNTPWLITTLGTLGPGSDSLFKTNSVRPSSWAGSDGAIMAKQMMYIRGPYHVLSWHYRDIYRRILDTTSWHHPHPALFASSAVWGLTSNVLMASLLDISPGCRGSVMIVMSRYWGIIEALVQYLPGDSDIVTRALSTQDTRAVISGSHYKHYKHYTRDTHYKHLVTMRDTAPQCHTCVKR